MGEVIIGKHTLESLTSGMYLDPFVVYREYIQNAVDSIDEACASSLLKEGEERIEITLIPSEHSVTIYDNGVGIASKQTVRTLLSIGNSKKNLDNSRGFRGIGRLSAFSYCSTLIFETSVNGEKTGTKITINAQKLSKNLALSNKDDTSILDLLKDVYCVESYNEKESLHYFKATLMGIDATVNLDNCDQVINYISQTAPVPYDPIDFKWGSEIDRRIEKKGFKIKHYNILVNFGKESFRVYKSYLDKFAVDKNNKLFDKIQDIDVITVKHSDGHILAVGWVGKVSYLGSLYNKTIKGLRLRKGNILIGDSQTLNVIFKDSRFNGWCIGEIHAIDPMLIPNARRDNLEKNLTYFLFCEQLSSIALTISKKIRNASLNRNVELASAINLSDKAKEQAKIAMEKGINSSVKGCITQKLSKALHAVENSSYNNDIDSYCKEIAFEELDIILGKLRGSTIFKAINMLEVLTLTEKKILEKVFKVIIENNHNNSSELIENILKAFSK